MGSEWDIRLLGDLAKEITVGFVGSMIKEYTNIGIPFLRSKNISEYEIDWNDMKYVSIQFHEKLKKSKLKSGDVAIVRTGKPGTTCVIPEDILEANCSDIVIVRVNDDLLSAHYLSYFMNAMAHGQVNAHVVGAVQQHFNVGSAKKIEIPLPSRLVQEQIVNVLKAIDDKRRVNRQINQTLEQMAQTLFKSWFVDFDPVIDNALAADNPIPEALQAKALVRQTMRDSNAASGKTQSLPDEIRNLFPSEFEESELGWIPKGWGVSTFSKVASQVRDNVKPEDISGSDIYIGLEHIGRKQLFLSDNGCGSDVSSNKSCFEKNDLLFGKLRPYFHKVALAPSEGICSTDILVFRANEDFFQSFMVLTANSEEFVDYANMRSTGTRMPRASAKDMLNYLVVVPSNSTLTAFESTISGYWGKGFLSVKQNQELTKLRDTLLPKLISGELRLDDVKQTVEKIKEVEACV